MTISAGCRFQDRFQDRFQHRFQSRFQSRFQGPISESFQGVMTHKNFTASSRFQGPEVLLAGPVPRPSPTGAFWAGGAGRVCTIDAAHCSPTDLVCGQEVDPTRMRTYVPRRREAR